MKYFAIEHPSRGVFTEWGENRMGLRVPKFRWSILRSEGERFYRREEADAELEKINKTLGNKTKAYILELGK